MTDPTHPRPYTVQVIEVTCYRGFVLATDIDAAEDTARDLLASRTLRADIGVLDVVHLDRDVTVNDSTQRCWRCLADPARPNRGCPHPAPEIAAITDADGEVSARG